LSIDDTIDDTAIVSPALRVVGVPETPETVSSRGVTVTVATLLSARSRTYGIHRTRTWYAYDPLGFPANVRDIVGGDTYGICVNVNAPPLTLSPRNST
jgi:hypothetical protein